MTAKEYLSEIQKYKSMMQVYADRIEELYHEAAGIKAIAYDKDRVQVSPENRFEAIMVKIDVEAQKWSKARLKYETEVRKRTEQIAGLKSTQQVQVLLLRYVEGKRWEEIACIIGYSFRHVTRLHGQALNAFTKQYKDVLLCPKKT